MQKPMFFQKLSSYNTLENLIAIYLQAGNIF